MASSRYVIAKHLDRLALQAKDAGETPATRKQCWYLAGLIEANGDDHAQLTDPLTKELASHLISQYLGEDEG